MARKTRSQAEPALPPVLDMAAVGEVLGRCRPGEDKSPLTVKTISIYRTQSHVPGGRYVDHPFPEPDGFVGGRPYWLPKRVRELQAWYRGRVGQGAGGGRPRKDQS